MAKEKGITNPEKWNWQTMEQLAPTASSKDGDDISRTAIELLEMPFSSNDLSDESFINTQTRTSVPYTQ